MALRFSGTVLLPDSDMALPYRYFRSAFRLCFRKARRARKPACLCREVRSEDIVPFARWRPAIRILFAYYDNGADNRWTIIAAPAMYRKPYGELYPMFPKCFRCRCLPAMPSVVAYRIGRDIRGRYVLSLSDGLCSSCPCVHSLYGKLTRSSPRKALPRMTTVRPAASDPWRTLTCFRNGSFMPVSGLQLGRLRYPQDRSLFRRDF